MEETKSGHLSEPQINLLNVGWNFKEVVEIARSIKPSNWIVIANKRRLSFLEVSLSQEGPSAIEKQFILNMNMESEAYVSGKRVQDGIFPFKLTKIRSPGELSACLKLFSIYNVCEGNKNFKRIDNGEVKANDYWKDPNCKKVYKKSLSRPENCCDACIMLNQMLPKKINNTYLRLSQPVVKISHPVSSSYLSEVKVQKAVKRKKPHVQNVITMIQLEDNCIAPQVNIMEQRPVKRKKVESDTENGIKTEYEDCISPEFIMIKEESIF